MGFRVAVQMDPIAAINIDGDSTFALMLEAQRRGHTLFHYHVRDLSMRGKDNITAKAHPVTVRREKGNHYSFAPRETIDLAACDVVLMRQDPPFDMAYITATHVLEHIHPRTLVVNDPAHVRNAPEKLFVTHFPQLMPPTLITADTAEIAAFRAEFKDIIVKPLYGNGGAGVFRIKPDDENLSSLIEMLTEREHEICEAIGPVLKKHGLIFVGIDVIGDWLTEINVTSPTGIREIARFDGTDLAAKIWDVIEEKR